ncbi:MAG: hypothetical protein FJX76_13210, partial [Armatimonadetes bacterium]|nr:hypothetical protein [Armatimonadota bacterium]
MPGPVENRSLNELSKVKRARRAARKPTKREHHQERVRTMVTWVLVFVFSVTSVGLLISMRQATTVTDRQTAADQAAQSADRIDALERKARENPKDASWQFQLA